MADQFTHRGVNFKVEHAHDDSHEAPWISDDGRGVVLDYLTDEQAENDGAMELYRELDSQGRYHFDQRATLDKARAEGWGLAPQDLQRLGIRLGHDPTPEEITAEAVEAEYRYLRGWAQDDWSYIGVVVTIPDFGGLRASLWGIESNAGVYLDEVARELADQILNEDLEEAINGLVNIARAAGVELGIG